MKQLGNLAVVCAKRKDATLQVQGGVATVHIRYGADKALLCAAWEDDAAIVDMIHELNFGRYSEKELNAQRST